MGLVSVVPRRPITRLPPSSGRRPSEHPRLVPRIPVPALRVVPPLQGSARRVTCCGSAPLFPALLVFLAPRTPELSTPVSLTLNRPPRRRRPPPPDGEQKERRVGGEQSRRRLLFSLRAAPKGRCFSRRSGHPGPLVSTFCVDGKNKQTVCCFLSFWS